MLSATNINDDKICDLNKVRYITKDEFKTQNERTKIQNGDILLTIVGTMGRSCIYSGVPKNVCFQRSVSVLTALIDNNYLKIVFDSKYIQDYMQFNAIGTAQKGFYLNQLSNLIIPVPPLNEQIRISKIISNVKDKISIITVNLKDIESITQEIRFKILESVFDENSSYKSYYPKNYLLGEILEYEQPGSYIVSSTDYNDEYKTPVLTPGKTFILGYTNEKEGIYHVDSKVIIFDDFTTASRLVNFDFKVKSSALKILHSVDENKFNIDYMYYLLQTINVISDTHKRFWISEYASKRISIHTYEEQLKIVDIINSSFGLLESIIK